MDTRLRLTTDDLFLLGACFMSCKQRLVDIREPGALVICDRIDAIATAIQAGQPLTRSQAQETAACVEAVRRKVRKDSVMNIRQRRIVLDTCERLIQMFTAEEISNVRT